MSRFQALVAAGFLLVATGAEAGALVSATFTWTLMGVPIVLGTPTGGTPTGTLSSGSFTLDAGTAFASTFCIGSPGIAGCIPMPAGPFAAPVTRLIVQVGANGALSGTTMGGTLNPATGIQGLVRVKAKIGKAPAFTLLPVTASWGVPNTVAIPSVTTPTSPPSLRVFVEFGAWHLGMVSETLLTNMSSPQPNVAATGNVSATSMGNTAINLVSLTRVRVRGLATSDTASPNYLRLVYSSVPEPGVFVLLGAVSLAIGGLKSRPPKQR